MIFYQFKCKKCGHEFEYMIKRYDSPWPFCPKCNGSVQKLIGPVPGYVKGTETPTKCQPETNKKQMINKMNYLSFISGIILIILLTAFVIWIISKIKTPPFLDSLSYLESIMISIVIYTIFGFFIGGILLITNSF